MAWNPGVVVVLSRISIRYLKYSEEEEDRAIIGIGAMVVLFW